jgi:hypothetical protein
MRSLMICSPRPVSFPGDKIEEIVIGVACSTCGERGHIYWVLAGTREAVRPLGRPRYRWENNIKVDLKVAECGGMSKM